MSYYSFPDTLVVSEVDDVLSLLLVACEYQIGRLVLVCEGALCRCADVDNACHLMRFARNVLKVTFFLFLNPYPLLCQLCGCFLLGRSEDDLYRYNTL